MLARLAHHKGDDGRGQQVKENRKANECKGEEERERRERRENRGEAREKRGAPRARGTAQWSHNKQGTQARGTKPAD